MHMKPRRLIIIALIVVIGVIALIAAVPFLIPASQYRVTLETAATNALGRQVKVGGPLRFSVYPTLGVTAEQVTVANAPGGAAPLFANVDELDVGVAVAPLLSGDVEVKTLILNKPTLALEADVAGKPNWLFEPKLTPEQKKTGGAGVKLERLGLGDVRIVGGALTYRDKLGKTQALSSLNATIALKSLDAPFALKSDFIYGGDPVKLTIAAPRPRALLEKKPTLLTVMLESEKLTAQMNGALDPADMSLAGKIDAKGPSLRKLAAWTGSPIGEGGGLGQFAVIGDVKTAGPVTTMSNAAVVVDNARGVANITITTAQGAPPYVAGMLALQALDVNPYLGAPQTPGSANAAKGVDVKQGWGADHIDLSGLKAINADLAITTGPLLFQKLKIDKSNIGLALRNGVMRATLKRLDLYGGVGSGLLVLDAHSGALLVQNNLSVSGLAAKAFLTDAVGLDKIEGSAKIDISIAAVGESQQALMNALDGKADFSFTNGALVGVNLAQIARQVQSALTGAAVGPAAKTDFAEMGSHFSIARGVAHTDDFHMLNPFIRITGAGDINVAQQTMDMKITPKAVKAIEGQGGKQDIGGLGIPFHVKGPWSKLKFEADLGGLVQDQVSKGLEGLGKSFNSSGLGGLFGQKPKPAPAP
jgi:AsmA protein